MKRNKFLLVILIAIFCKVLLYSLLVINSPQSSFQNDSFDYLETAKTLYTYGAFAKINSIGILSYEFYRTPGYPIYLVLTQYLLKLSINGVLLTQILLSLFAAFITYKAANKIDKRIAFLSLFIILYDPPIAIFSLMILSEALFLVFMSLFLFSFVQYLSNKRINYVFYSALILAIATYIRPITYYFGLIVAIFILYVNMRFNIKKAIIHALIFLIAVYGIIGIWQLRNYKRFQDKAFCNVVKDGYTYLGLYKSYSRNKANLAKNMSPVKYYTVNSTRAFLSIMTRPGPFKYFKSKKVRAIGNVFSYPWMIFWVSGFIVGVFKIRRNIHFQFLCLVIAYLIVTSIIGVSTLVSERFRVPMVPFLAIISAFGWINIMDRLKAK